MITSPGGAENMPEAFWKATPACSSVTDTRGMTGERELKVLPADERKEKRLEREGPVWEGFWKWLGMLLIQEFWISLTGRLEGWDFRT